MRPDGGILSTESFDEGVETVYDLGGSPPYQVNAAPLRDVGKT